MAKKKNLTFACISIDTMTREGNEKSMKSQRNLNQRTKPLSLPTNIHVDRP